MKVIRVYLILKLFSMDWPYKISLYSVFYLFVLFCFHLGRLNDREEFVSELKKAPKINCPGIYCYAQYLKIVEILSKE